MIRTLACTRLCKDMGFANVSDNVALCYYYSLPLSLLNLVLTSSPILTYSQCATLTCLCLQLSHLNTLLVPMSLYPPADSPSTTTSPVSFRQPILQAGQISRSSVMSFSFL
jgi:hypothetical protein